jgi:5-(carboxyamino)imidazole ribonucleotide mutase
MTGKVLILMASERDMDFSREIAKHLKTLGIEYRFRVASVHKTPEKVMEILKECEGDQIIYITVAGKSNALSPFVDANTTKPVIACPPYSEKFGGVDIYSSLRVPSGVAPLFILEPEGAAIAAAKIFALRDPSIEKRTKQYQQMKKSEIEKADESVKEMK